MFILLLIRREIEKCKRTIIKKGWSTITCKSIYVSREPWSNCRRLRYCELGSRRCSGGTHRVANSRWRQCIQFTSKAIPETHRDTRLQRDETLTELLTTGTTQEIRATGCFSLRSPPVHEYSAQKISHSSHVRSKTRACRKLNLFQLKRNLWRAILCAHTYLWKYVSQFGNCDTQ